MPAARLLDLTRSLRRTGRIPTGIDRVELAYLSQFLADSTSLFGLVRTAYGYLLLDREGMERIDRGASPDSAGEPREQAKELEAQLRRSAVARCLPFGLKRMLRARLPEGFAYFNIGHSNLTERVLGGVKGAGGQIHVLIHDVIPLDFPHYQRPGTIEPFREKLRQVSRHADRVIYNSEDTRRRSEAVLEEMGHVPAATVAHLGAPLPRPDPSALRSTLPPERPYFITVGTIEPRKNHAFLLDLWDRMGDAAPPLLICGSRGWENHEVFARLDRLRPGSPVQEINGLPDQALAALVQGAAGALFPTHAEGFGLPMVEAHQLGTRVLCNDIATLREILVDRVTLIPVNAPQDWLDTIQRWHTDRPARNKGPATELYTWSDHFKTVLKSE